MLGQEVVNIIGTLMGDSRGAAYLVQKQVLYEFLREYTARQEAQDLQTILDDLLEIYSGILSITDNTPLIQQRLLKYDTWAVIEKIECSGELTPPQRDLLGQL